jgi:hypothetical protein
MRGQAVTDLSALCGNLFHVYRTTGDKLRLSAIALAGLRPEAVVRLGVTSVAPGGSLTRPELDAWLDELRRHDVSAEMAPPDELT